MDLAEGFRNHKEKIVKKWVEYALSTYAASDTLSKQTDKFANPIGGVIRDALQTLFALLIKNADSEEFVKPLEKLIALRAVQEFSPSQAVAPVNAVKHIVRDVFSSDKEREHLVAELYDFEFAVDLAMLKAFDIYMQYRERLYEVRCNEIRTGSSILTDSKCPSKLLSDDDRGLKTV